MQWLQNQHIWIFQTLIIRPNINHSFKCQRTITSVCTDLGIRLIEFVIIAQLLYLALQNLHLLISIVSQYFPWSVNHFDKMWEIAKVNFMIKIICNMPVKYISLSLWSRVKFYVNVDYLHVKTNTNDLL